MSEQTSQQNKTLARR
jgi:steroid delta-isomerase-like uncharacterized protein